MGIAPVLNLGGLQPIEPGLFEWTDSSEAYGGALDGHISGLPVEA